MLMNKQLIKITIQIKTEKKVLEQQTQTWKTLPIK